MKTIFKIIILALVIVTFTSCSSDDDSGSNNNEIVSKLIGTWGVINPNDNLELVELSFYDNGSVKYYTYFNYPNPELEEIGNWSVNGSILTMDFTETVLLRYVQNVIFIGDNELQFQRVENSEDDPWNENESFYRMEDPNLN